MINALHKLSLQIVFMLFLHRAKHSAFMNVYSENICRKLPPVKSNSIKRSYFRTLKKKKEPINFRVKIITQSHPKRFPNHSEKVKIMPNSYKIKFNLIINKKRTFKTLIFKYN